MVFELPDGRKRAYGRLEDLQTAVPGAALWQGLPLNKCNITVNSTDFFYKVMTRHDTGLGEAYMHGDIDVDDVGAFMAILTANAYSIEGNRGILGAFNWLGDRLLYLAHLTRANTVEGSKRNIREHYDAGNEMYKLFLDDSLTYSAGIHTEGACLKDSQLRKLDALISGARITGDSHVLEVGCGWGSCAIRAAQTTGCKWTGVNYIYIRTEIDNGGMLPLRIPYQALVLSVPTASAHVECPLQGQNTIPKLRRNHCVHGTAYRGPISSKRRWARRSDFLAFL